MRQKLLFLLVFSLASLTLFAQVAPQTMQQIQLLLQEKNSRTPTQKKISSRLLQALRENRGEKMAAGVDLDPADVNADANGALKVDIKADVTESLLLKIKALGGTIIYPSVQYHTVRAMVNLKDVETIAGYAEVKFIGPAVKSRVVDAGENIKENGFEERALRVRAELMTYLITHVDAIGKVTSQGDEAHGAATVRSTDGYLGTGIRVGVLSDSYNSTGGAAADVTSGDLPGTGNPDGYTTPVVVVQDVTGATDEGRAMLQVVHDLAPGALLYFATGDVSEAGFASNIEALQAAPNNCNIIIDDLGYFDEAVFQDGIVAQAVDSVTNAGALYFSAAGNSGALAEGTSSVFEGDFNDAGSLAFAGSSKAGSVHNFGTVASPVNGDIVTVRGEEVYNLTWSDPYGASGNDYDLFLVSSSGTVKESSTDVQTGTQDPYEETSAPRLVSGDRLVVFKDSAAAVRAFHLNANGGGLTKATNGQTAGHPCAIKAFCMAATPASAAAGQGYPSGPYPGLFISTNVVEPYSSDGPRKIFYNPDGSAITPGNFLFGTNGGTTLSKPDLTGADGVSTTFAASTGLNPFFGTSCAGPHAGGVAALLLSANPTLTEAQVREILTTTALDIQTKGYDVNSGYGIVQAIQAIEEGTLPIKLLTFTATKEGGQNLLQWATTQELNSSYFAVERSIDGVSFAAIGNVNATGNSSATKSYSLKDAKPVNGINYYRLKMIDKDGQFSYSAIRSITEVASFGVSIYPNPVQNNLSLNFNSANAMTVQVSVVDNGGKVVATQQMAVVAGISTQSINVGGMSSGTYYVRLVNADGETELRFVKEK